MQQGRGRTLRTRYDEFLAARNCFFFRHVGGNSKKQMPLIAVEDKRWPAEVRCDKVFAETYRGIQSWQSARGFLERRQKKQL